MASAPCLRVGLPSEFALTLPATCVPRADDLLAVSAHAITLWDELGRRARPAHGPDGSASGAPQLRTGLPAGLEDGRRGVAAAMGHAPLSGWAYAYR
ncbi:MAG TPA: hypothetical protein VGI58_09575 [Streptosporangiaceae bacterium]